MHRENNKCNKNLVRKLEGRDHSQELGIGGGINIKIDFKEIGRKVWIGFT
jgi:hypothetical protein